MRHFLVFVSTRARAPGDPTEPPPTRLGITVTRKVGNAVTRNRIKRLVREVFRQHRHRLPAGLDMVWVAKQQAAGASFADVLADFEALARRSAELTGGGSRPRRGRRRNNANKKSRARRGE